MFDLHGMTALVTGASGGIGSSIARALAAQGARLAVSGSNAAKLRAFRDELDEHTPQHLQEVDHVAVDDPVDHIAHGATENQRYRQAKQLLSGMAIEQPDDERAAGHLSVRLRATTRRAASEAAVGIGNAAGDRRRRLDWPRNRRLGAQKRRSRDPL